MTEDLEKENKELKKEHEKIINFLNKELHKNDDNDECARRVKVNLIKELMKILNWKIR